MLGLNEANVNIFSWIPLAPGADKPVYGNFRVVTGVSHPKDRNRLKKKSLEDGRKVAGHMQHTNHFHALSARSVEDEIALKSSDREDAHIFQTLAPKIPDTAHTWQCHQLLTCLFQCRHKARRRLRIVGPDIFYDFERILPSLRAEKGRGEHSALYYRFDWIRFRGLRSRDRDRKSTR